MLTQEELIRAYAQGQADREAGNSNRTSHHLRDTVLNIVTVGGASHLPPTHNSAIDKAYNAGYHAKDKK